MHTSKDSMTLFISKQALTCPAGVGSERFGFGLYGDDASGSGTYYSYSLTVVQRAPTGALPALAYSRLVSVPWQ
jgi:hypothetical protein